MTFSTFVSKGGQAAMRRHKKDLGSLVLAAIAMMVMGWSLAANAHALDCQPATPCPCAADGTCSPQGPWGHTPTRWRRWPGDVVEEQAATREEEEKQEELRLEPYETPPPEKEALRGAETPESRRKKSSRDSGEGPVTQPLDGLEPGFEPAQPALEPQQPLGQPQPEGGQPAGIDGFEMPEGAGLEEPVEDAPLPESEPIDDFDPFSNFDQEIRAPRTVEQPATPVRQMPSSGPPALPASLQKLSRTMGPTRRSGRALQGPRHQAKPTVALAH